MEPTNTPSRRVYTTERIKARETDLRRSAMSRLSIWSSNLFRAGIIFAAARQLHDVSSAVVVPGGVKTLVLIKSLVVGSSRGLPRARVASHSAIRFPFSLYKFYCILVIFEGFIRLSAFRDRLLVVSVRALYPLSSKKSRGLSRRCASKLSILTRSPSSVAVGKHHLIRV